MEPKPQQLLQGFDKNGDDEEDRLSALPDDILIKILSLLPINSAVATDVLSRRWSYLWTSITAFRFETSSEHALKFKDIYQLHFPHINTFRLRLHDLCHHVSDPKLCAGIGFCLDSWILQLCFRKIVKHIEIRLTSCLGYKIGSYLLRCLLQSKSLVSLILRKIDFLPFTLPQVITLPNLKTLHVCRICNPTHFLLFIKLINESCPRLEDLYLSGYVTGQDHIVISCRTLKELYVGLYSNDVDPPIVTRVTIDAPKLEYLGVAVSTGLVSVKLANKKPTSVLRAAKLTYGCSMDVFQAICSVKTLNMNSYVMDALNCLDDYSQLPTFSNLTSLFCTMSSPACWKALLAALHCSAAKLKALTIRMVGNPERANEVSWVPIDYSRLPCSLRQVKRIAIYLGGICAENEMELIKCLLFKAIALEVLSVKLPISEAEGNEIQQQKESELLENLSKLHRSSSSCHIKVCGYVLPCY